MGYLDDFSMTVNGEPLRCVELTDQNAIFELQYTVPQDVSIPDELHTGMKLNNKSLPVDPVDQLLEVDKEHEALFEVAIPPELIEKGFTFSAIVTTLTQGALRPMASKVMLKKQANGLYVYQKKLKGNDGQICTTTLTITMIDPSGKEVPGAVYTNSITVRFKKTAVDITVKSVGSVSFTVTGQSVTVDHTSPCKLAYLEGGQYVSLKAIKNMDSTYSFVVPDGVTEVILAVKGDITGDGRINVGDVSKLYAHVMQTSQLTGDVLFVADITGDNRIDVGDVSKLYVHVKQTALLTWDT